MVECHDFENREEASRALALQVAADLRHDLRADKETSLVVTGGTSPQQCYGILRTMELDWLRVTIVPSDERWVALDHADSNERMIRNELIQQQAEQAKLISLYDADDSQARLVKKQLTGIALPFSCVILGMGEDGHIASLFPTTPGIEQTLVSKEPCLMQDVPGLPVPRITLTLHTLLQTRKLYLIFFGEAKKAIIEKALQPGPPESLPVRTVLHQEQVPVEIYWAA
jgi:6-phosphogluconolactonase